MFKKQIMGSYIIIAAFVAAFGSSILYFLNASGKISSNNIKAARFLFHASVILVISSTAYLMYLIITHQFQFTYVWNYSSKDLPVNLLISTFYAGQEGSFHMWASLMSVLGIFLLSYLANRDNEIKLNGGGKHEYEPLMMGIFTLLQAFLIFILIIKSPYKMVWESFPKDVQAGFIPEDGRGLNPLLQNFWMTIHPPILFAGFTALSVPFCFAITALIKNDYSKWMKLALPWTLFGAMILGLGIMLGGYWAYGVLGWGGYWAWDPVENSSFIPWLIIIAGVHTMVAEEKINKFKKTALILCIMAYVFVLYSTFLTRSGVLGDASVHSFVDPGQEVYLFLVVFLSLFGAGGIGLLLFRLKSLRTNKTEQTNLLSREAALFTGAVTICAAALVIAVGTSWPIMSKGTVDAAFYNKMNLPVAILIAAINGISILLKWKHSEEKEFIKGLYIPLALTGAVTIVLVIIGVRDFLIALFAAAAMFSFFINAQIAYTIFIRNKAKAGAYIAHMGLMLLFLGIIGSGRYSEEVNVSLPIDQQKEALGYKLTYKGATPIKDDEQKFHFNVVVEKEGQAFLLQPIMYYSDYSEGVMKNPDIANLFYKDLYLSPMSLEEPNQISQEDMHTFKKGEEIKVSDMKIKFIDFDRSKFNRDEMTSGKQNIMGAELEVTVNGKTQKLVAEQELLQGNSNAIPVKLSENDKYTFQLIKLSVSGEPTIDIAITDDTKQRDPSPETLVLTASIKPFINFVWGGTIVMVIGFFLALMARYNRMKSETRKINSLHSNGNGQGSTKKHQTKEPAGRT